MPVLTRTDDALEAARELWSEITSDHDAIGHLEYGAITLSCGFCDEHNVYELMLKVSDELVGIDSVNSADELARIIDAIMCFQDMAHNLAKLYVKARPSMPVKSA